MNKKQAYYRGAAEYCRDTQLRQETTASVILPTDDKSDEEIASMRRKLQATVASMLERRRNR